MYSTAVTVVVVVVADSDGHVNRRSVSSTTQTADNQSTSNSSTSNHSASSTSSTRLRHEQAQHAQRSSTSMFTQLLFRNRQRLQQAQDTGVRSAVQKSREEARVIKINPNGIICMVPKYGIEGAIQICTDQQAFNSNQSGGLLGKASEDGLRMQLFRESESSFVHVKTVALFDRIDVDVWLDEEQVRPKLSFELVIS